MVHYFYSLYNYDYFTTVSLPLTIILLFLYNCDYSYLYHCYNYDYFTTLTLP